MISPNLYATCLFLLAGSLDAAVWSLSGKVVDPKGNPISGVSVVLATSKLQAMSAKEGTWALNGEWTGIGPRARPQSVLRWTGRDVELALDVPATVSIEAYGIGGASRGRIESMRLDAGRHSIPLDLSSSSGVTVLKVVVNGRAETVLASSGLGRARAREWGGVPGNRPAIDAGRALAERTDTLLFRWRYRTQARILLSRTDSAGIVAVIDTTTTFVGSYGVLEDARDGQKYRTVRIGDQNWMAENLNFKPSGDDSGWKAGPVGAAGYGRLYDWAAALALPADCNENWCGARNRAMSPTAQQSREGICPKGWHVPSVQEWDTLLVRTGCWTNGQYLESACTGLAAGHGWSYQEGGTDSFGFGVLPAGFRMPGDTIEEAGKKAQFWLSDESEWGGEEANYGFLFSEETSMWSASDERRKSIAMSLRCVEGAATLDTSTALASLSVDVGSLSPAFVPAMLSYVDTIPVATQTIRIMAKTASPSAYIVSTSFRDYYGGDSNSVDINADSSIKLQVYNSGRSRTYTIRPVYKPVDPANFGTLVDSRAGGQTYRTVKIGTQNWMAENLNFSVDGSWWYKDSEDSGKKYGRLYAWHALMALPDSCDTAACASQIQPKHRGICPSGWHVPSPLEWDTLETFVGGGEDAFDKLKSKTGWESGRNGTDAVGFHLLPAGYRVLTPGIFLGAGWASVIWNTSLSPSVSGGQGHWAISARCLQD